jgi:hypothetical protein
MKQEEDEKSHIFPPIVVYVSSWARVEIAVAVKKAI